MTSWLRLATAFIGAVATGVLATAGQGDAVKGAFTCGEDQSLSAPIPLLWNTIVLAGDGRLYSPCPAGEHGQDHREIREAALIGEARYLPSELRWRAAQAIARNSLTPQAFPVPGRGSSSEGVAAQVDGLGGLIAGSFVQPACAREVQLFGDATDLRRWQPGRLFHMFQELQAFAVRQRTPAPWSEPAMALVRQQVAREGAYGIGVLLSRPNLDADLITAAKNELRACLLMAGNREELAGMILENLGLPGYRESQLDEIENLLAQESHGTALKILGAVKGLEALVRLHPQHELGDAARLRLRELVTFADGTDPPTRPGVAARVRRLALLALQAARAIDYPTLRSAATDEDWQVRRLAAGNLNLSDPQMARIGDGFAVDPAFQVRYELLAPLSRRAAQTGDCLPIVARFNDPSPAVAMRAMDVLPTSCAQPDQVVKALLAFADRLTNSADDGRWHVSSRALTALVRVRPPEARIRLAAAADSGVWQVRAAAASASAALGDEAAAMTLAADSEPNVRTAALSALSRLGSAAVVPAALNALRNGSDYQLIRMAATVLRGLPADSKEDASKALLAAMRTLSDQESDTSREARLAIVERLGETLRPEQSSDLLPFAADLDDEVNAAVSRVFGRLSNGPLPAVSPKRRYPYQPSAASLNALPSEASIRLEEGTVTLRLLSDVAPVTTSRFAELVARGYYTGLTFHRVVPNAYVQGGSPGANDLMGTTRYMRDELGPQGVHVRGAVGMSARGRDMGDGQIFIDLVDVPQFDRRFTVFGYVTNGMDLVDRILDGAKIVGVAVK